MVVRPIEELTRLEEKEKVVGKFVGVVLQTSYDDRFTSIVSTHPATQSRTAQPPQKSTSPTPTSNFPLISSPRRAIVWW